MATASMWLDFSPSFRRPGRTTSPAQPAAADQNDLRLYGLFAKLGMVTDQAEVRVITGMI